ncbi:CSLREA domain-containing protein [Wenzhouxiangella marina]|uniref:Uncharacterized protein n=1 Tax=Wenzhouxiangella marina TaxID=1579979 RepID=A0A0K0XZN3_9GAMM|nr:CSLREA domain-containing protein [Wenzhouxiangella marina]AKS43148.1 hypothetical protein WM2015_2791 [Wenzhouxiangella marina]MBB6087167.1 CSLREA domain-containing protein [Wenzhouxiangella marina]
MSNVPCRALCSILFISLGTLISGPLSAALIFVDEPSDAVVNDNNCSLREAVLAANTNQAVDDCAAGDSSGPDGVFVLIGQTGLTISLQAPLVVTDTTNIIGPGIDNLVLVPGGAGTFPAFEIDVANAGEDFSLSNLRIEGFQDSAVQIVNADQVLFDRVGFDANVAPTVGGAINSRSFPVGPTQSLTELTLRDSEFVQNNASSLYGGAVYIGGSISDAADFDLTVEGSVFINNRADREGGAIAAAVSSGLLVIRESVFQDNLTSIGANAFYQGGALISDFASTQISGSLFINNDSTLGRSIASGSSQTSAPVAMTITNSTFINDVPPFPDAQAEIHVDQNETRIQYSSFQLSARAAIRAGSAGTARLIGSLFVTDVPPCEGDGSFLSSGYNLETHGDSCTSQASDLPFTDVELLPLGDYGGPTETLPPHPASAAVDAGPLSCEDATGNSVLTVDQRGEARPRDGNASGGLGQCDIGAFEWGNAYMLSVGFPGTGGGQVSLVDDLPLGCDAPDFCQLPLPRDQSYTLVASPAPGSQFNGWGGACSGQGPCVVNLTTARVVTADFEVVSDSIFSSRFEN